MSSRDTALVLDLSEVGRDDIGLVGGKNASLGEMIRNLGAAGVRVPGGFAVTATAYRLFMRANELEQPVADLLDELHAGAALDEIGPKIRELVRAGEVPGAVRDAVANAYARMCQEHGADQSVAVRSSATAEDLPEASFAGQQETYLNVVGIDDLLESIRDCFASLYTDRAITYREHHGFEHHLVAISVAAQLMVRSDVGAAGVAFTIDTESGFPEIVLINGAWGLGEYVVKGVVTPDEWRVFKPLLDDANKRPILDRSRGPKERKLVFADRQTEDAPTTVEEQTQLVLDDEQVLDLARWCAKIEQHYGCPMDIEWALDGQTGEMWIVQARPETVQSRTENPVHYTLTGTGEVLTKGVAVGNAIATGKAFVLESMAHASRFEDGGVLVTTMTDPDWVPLMKRASGLITEHGGRTSHAAIVSRELGIPAIVGTGDATSTIPDGDVVTLSCAEGEFGQVYVGEIGFERREIDLTDLPSPATRLMLNVADPEAAMRFWNLPVHGIGLARLEFVIEHQIGVHPMALLRFDELDAELQAKISEITRGYDDKTDYFVNRLAAGIAKIAASQWPDPVVVRTSDFKSNEYADLLGGRAYEPHEENPMIGFRGASRYHHDRYRAAFQLECEALRQVRDEIGFDNVIVMIPFCRTLEEADAVLDVMAKSGLPRGANGLKIYVMAEIPSNVILADEFAKRFDGFSIGSNDLTQLILGVDRDNGFLHDVFDERNPAVLRAIEDLVATAHAHGVTVGICGQAPSDHPEFAEFLVGIGIDSISLNPDSVVDVVRRVHAFEQARNQKEDRDD